MAHNLERLITICGLTGLLISGCAEDSDTEAEVAYESDEVTAPETDSPASHVACSAAQYQRIDGILARRANRSAGAQLFAQTCGTVLCHGADGNSGPAPSLAETVPDHSARQLACVLLIGPGEMTSLETLSDQQLSDLIVYVRATY